MANILDYLDWRGDLSLCADPFNEVDNYICAQFGTPDFTMIIPENAREITLREAVDYYGTLWGEKGDRLGLLVSPHVLPMLRKCRDTVRFGDIRLSHFVNIVDEYLTEQFSAVCVHLCDGSCYVAFRGTDDTLLGWEEDFMLCVLDQVAAQRDALAYLENIAREVEGPIMVGGHSKGGNLAVYAAIHASEEVQRRITAVYNNDGPGFRESVVHTPGYLRMEDRIHNLLPQHSMIGLLLEQSGQIDIVRSVKAGPEAHDGFNWEVLGTRFVREADFSRSGKVFNEVIERQIAGMDQQQRSDFVNELFLLLCSTGAKTLTELMAQGRRVSLTLLRDSRKSPALHSFLLELFSKVMREYAGDVAADMKESVLDYASDMMKQGRRLLSLDRDAEESDAPADDQ